MKRRLSQQQVRRFHRLLSVRMTDFDCGKLCAPGNKGVPICCDCERVVPVLFRAEWKWLRKQGKLWKRMPVKTKVDRKMVKKVVDYSLYCVCKGPAACRRGQRAIVCRTFPFEPFVDGNGSVRGLVFQSQKRKKCPLVTYPRSAFNDRYVRNAVRFWQELIDAIPEERELYMRESRKHKRRAARKGRPLRMLTASP